MGRGGGGEGRRWGGGGMLRCNIYSGTKAEWVVMLEPRTLSCDIITESQGEKDQILEEPKKMCYLIITDFSPYGSLIPAGCGVFTQWHLKKKLAQLCYLAQIFDIVYLILNLMT